MPMFTSSASQTRKSGSERWNLKKSKKMKRRTVQPQKIQKHEMADRTTRKNPKMTGKAF
jgi:hypothetical protein